MDLAKKEGRKGALLEVSSPAANSPTMPQGDAEAAVSQACLGCWYDKSKNQSG